MTAACRRYPGPPWPAITRPSRPLTTHAERVAISRHIPPPSTAVILEQVRRLVAADLADDGEAYRAERLLSGLREPGRLTLGEAVHLALVELRDGWLERPAAGDEVRDAEWLLAAAAGLSGAWLPGLRRDLDAWSRGVSRAVVLSAVERACVAGEEG